MYVIEDDILVMEMNQGEDFKFDVTWEDEEGTPVDVSNHTAKMQLRSSAGHPRVYLEASSANGRFTVDEGNNKLKLKIESAVIDELTFKNAVGDLFVFDSEGEPEKLFRIKAQLIKRVTE